MVARVRRVIKAASPIPRQNDGSGPDANVDEVLLPLRFVEVVLALEDVLDLFGDVAPAAGGVEGAAGGDLHQDEGDDGDEEQDGDDPQDPANEVAEHVWQSFGP